MKGEGLLPREEAFCRQYVVLRNGARAARAAGYSEKRARITASELLTKRNIRERLAELEKELRGTSEVSKEQIIAELKAVAFSNIQDNFSPAVGEGGRYLPYGEEVIRGLSEAPRYVTAAIRSINVDKKGHIDISWFDKLAALGKLADILGLTNSANIEVEVKAPIIDGLSEARERLADYVRASA